MRLVILNTAKIAGILNSATPATLLYVTIVARLVSAQSVWPISAPIVKSQSRLTPRHAYSVFATRDTKRFIDVVSTALIAGKGGVICTYFHKKSTKPYKSGSMMMSK